MWFATISLVLAVLCYIEGVAGMLFPRQYSAWVRQQLSGKTPSLFLRVLFVYAMLLAAATWYATLTRYTTHGWVLTLLTTLMAAKVVVFLSAWKWAAAASLAFLDRADDRLGRYYGIAILLGVLLLWLGLFVY